MYALRVVDGIGCKKEVTCGGGHPFFFIMTHINGVTQNIQLVSSLLYSYWSTTPEYPYLLEASTSYNISHFT